jgi:hypothetical protein
MRILWFALALGSLSSPAVAAGKDFCRALIDLKNEARSTGDPQHVAVLKVEAMTFACERNEGVAAQVAFCTAAGKAVGLEFTHEFPWLVYDCLRAAHITPGVETIEQYTGLRARKKMTRLWASWPDGTRLDIRFQPLGDFADAAELRDYWGSYKLVIWQPSSVRQ